MARKPLLMEIAGREVSISNPEKVFVRETGYTKLDLMPPRTRGSARGGTAAGRLPAGAALDG